MYGVYPAQDNVCHVMRVDESDRHEMGHDCSCSPRILQSCPICDSGCDYCEDGMVAAYGDMDEIPTVIIHTDGVL